MKPQTQPHPFRLFASCNAAALVFLTGAAMTNLAGAAVTTVGVYDENTTDESTTTAGIQNNSVDFSSTSDTGNQVSLATFKTAVTSAFNSNFGGVINFDNGSITGGVGTSSITASYGTSQAKSITIANGVANNWLVQTTSTSRTGISHPGNDILGHILSITGNTLNAIGPDFSFNFSVSDKVIMVGGTLLSRSGATNQSVTARATYSDTTSSFVTFTSDGANNAGDDTFAGFKAPDGLFITNFVFDLPTDQFRTVDDLGFVVVPEPTSATLLGGLGVLMLMRRKRNQR